MRPMIRFVVTLALCNIAVNAFLPPRHILADSYSVWTVTVPCLLESYASLTYEAAGSSTLFSPEDIYTSKSVPFVLLAATIAIPILAVVKFLFSSYIIPEAAKQLESETKELAPKLWREMKDELEDGEILEQRPDLMEKVFTKIQPYLLKEIADQMQERSESEEDEQPQK
ncbi:hypothetical protein FisN_6Lh155 [Fistulifera solaris]|uniref:Uncharacterized protein n=1 Tax=Fistulifera solaris TaxID=1519565 RepID=A0A1Z5J6B2_FISSO|nr:hypothetical protein FisN_6Lh155 [Fistulifera solaris]|eukprot:GAX09466.1 hypothetical protein FisN_6Lh155 [Fistulifera solaris]